MLEQKINYSKGAEESEALFSSATVGVPSMTENC